MYYCPNYGAFSLVGNSLGLNGPGLYKISGKCQDLFRDETGHIKEHRLSVSSSGLLSDGRKFNQPGTSNTI
jgi:hypothetical protein